MFLNLILVAAMNKHLPKRYLSGKSPAGQCSAAGQRIADQTSSP